MLIAIFALMLVSVVAIALVISSGTDSALAGNYRTSSSAYYAAVAGLEEARGRLLWKNPDYINKANAYSNLLSATGVPTWGLQQVLYITNPGPGETVNPTSANPANYPDTEYGLEFPHWGLGGATIFQIPSVSAGSGIPGPSYKWVRINAVSEQAINVDVNGDSQYNWASPLVYDPAPAYIPTCPPANPSPGLFVPCPTPTSNTAVQALEITALAVAPNGGQRLLQYVVAPLIISPDMSDQNFPAALTLDGNGVVFQSPGSTSFKISGLDLCKPAVPPTGLPGAVSAVGTANPGDNSSISTALNPPPPSTEALQYPGAPVLSSVNPPGYTEATPSVSNLNLPTPGNVLRQSWLTPAALDAQMQDIVNSADVVIAGPATGTDISTKAPLMAASSPMTIVVKGDLNLAGWHNTGYGLLLVTGTLHYDPDASWNGLVLVVGQGVFSSSNSGSGGFNGAVLVATTRDNAGNLLTGNTLGPAFFGSKTGGYGSNPGFGINYSSCLVNGANGPLSYKVLSFREISLPN